MAARNLSVGPVPRLVVTLALPVLGTLVLQSLYALADLFFVGRIGGAALAGVGISLNTFYLVLAVGMSIGTGGLALLSQTYGRGEHDRVPHLFQVVFWLSGMVGLASAVAVYLGAEPFMRAFTQDPDVTREGVAFLRVYSATFFPQVMLIALAMAFRAVGDFLVPTAIMALSVLLNVALDPLLIFGLGPLPGMGVTGAALATLLAEFAALGGYGWLLAASRRNTLLVLRRPFVWDWKIAGRVLGIGLPSAFQMVLYTAALLLSFRYLRPLGGDPAAALSVGFRVVNVGLMPGIAIGAAAASLAGQNFGAGNFSRVRATMFWSALYVVLANSVEYALVLAAPHFWVASFAREAGIVELGARYLVITGAALPFFGISLIANPIFQGLGRTVEPLVGPGVRLGATALGLAALERWFDLTAERVFWVGSCGILLEVLAITGAMLLLWRRLLSRPDRRAGETAARGAPAQVPAGA